MSVVVVISVLSSSAAKLSEPAALLLLSSLMVILISMGVGSPVFFGSSIGFSHNLGGFLGAFFLECMQSVLPSGPIAQLCQLLSLHWRSLLA